jgi:hypothetical protein
MTDPCHRHLLDEQIQRGLICLLPELAEEKRWDTNNPKSVGKRTSSVLGQREA